MNYVLIALHLPSSWPMHHELSKNKPVFLLKKARGTTTTKKGGGNQLTLHCDLLEQSEQLSKRCMKLKLETYKISTRG